MPEGLTFVMGLILGALIAVGASVAFIVSERQHRAESRREREGALESATSVFNALPQAHIVIDAHDRIVRASPRAYAYGLIWEAQLRADVADLIRDARARGKIVDADLVVPRETMDEAADLRLWLRAAPVEGDHILVLLEDMTAKRRLEETRRDFVANVSHELKTPVGAVRLLAETIHSVADEPEHVRHFSEKMMAESERLGNLVKEIIQLSQLQEGDSLADSDVVSVDQVIEEALDRVRIEAENRNVSLISGGRSGLRVYGDQALLTTAIRNLLDNAVRYSRPHSRVSISAINQDGEVHVIVLDQGEGIEPDVQPRIFERFYRGDKARSRETGGSGLGLAIVKHVVADHGGRIKLWSEVGKGSTFTVILPEAYTPDMLEEAQRQGRGSTVEGE
ncbi:sensor histidine kinase [Arcanobacterium haemolyticum]|uniref:Sensor-like histidine kinase SenX3 n=1 Tax=Arcanobacterium haemolyticum (strain ATCC 9345 / DSM 20595 / CCM 5947 / CCUG 17215 / LMG 16163 / NBRC 15585 / NCTC 8452 / 11018) TaxID=644284 RepID=D7BL20_ARCHD|nr:ATP-binding protein [Arcanobacterium haemolyticum]ADH93350.1 histidine kinase [Arcanobacterium haemolyticum DSM 20595]SQH27791.1 Signal-transduction histidine kinase senX3 [Arcanobacterium haemolyticum]